MLLFPSFRKQLANLRALLDSAKESMSEKEKELVKSAIVRYSDLAYDLSGLVTEVIAFIMYLFPMVAGCSYFHFFHFFAQELSWNFMHSLSLQLTH